MYYVMMTALSAAFLALASCLDGWAHTTCLIMGGAYLGHVMTEALNYH